LYFFDKVPAPLSHRFFANFEVGGELSFFWVVKSAETSENGQS
jgi:hypothetical protein